MAASSLSAPPPPIPGASPLVRRPDLLQRRDGLTKAQLRAVVAAIAALHIGGGYAVLQIPAVREAVVDAAPVFVNFIAPPEPPKPEVLPPPPPPPPRKMPRPPAPAPVMAAPPSPAPAPYTVPPPPPVPEPVAPPEPVPPPPAPPAPSPPPVRVIAPEAVRWEYQPKFVYPRQAERRRESGTVTLRILIGTDGLPKDVRVAKSSGFTSLDEGALEWIRKGRFKPYVENGLPMSSVVTLPVEFVL